MFEKEFQLTIREWFKDIHGINGYSVDAGYVYQDCSVVKETEKAIQIMISGANRTVWLPKKALKRVEYKGNFAGYDIKKWFTPDDYQTRALWENPNVVDQSTPLFEHNTSA